MDELIWDESFPVRIVLTLLHFLWQGSVLTLGLVVAAWFCRRAAAQVRYSIGVAALLIMAACPPATFVLVDVPPPPAMAFVEVESEPARSPAIPAGPPAGPAPRWRVPEVASSPEEAAGTGTLRSGTAGERDIAASAGDGPDVARAVAADDRPGGVVPPLVESGSSGMSNRLLVVAPYLLGAYSLGVLVMLLRLALALRGGQRLRRCAVPVNDECLLATVSRQVQRLGLKAAPAVAYCREISIPIVVGVVKPMILLPAALVTSLSTDQLAVLVTHELAHIRRLDLFVNLLQRLIEALLFFHPAVWYVSRRISVEREQAADDTVVTAGFTRVHYADVLVRMAELAFSLRGQAVANQAAALAASGTQPSDLKRRVMRLLGKEIPQLRLTRVGLAALVLVAAITALVPLCVAPIMADHREQQEPVTNKSQLANAVPLDQPFPHEVKIWPDLKRVDRILNRKPLQTFTSFSRAAWLDGSQTIMVGDRAGFAVWDVNTGRLKQRLPTNAWNGGVVRVSRDGRRLLTTGDYTDTRILEWPSLEVTHSISAHQLGPRSRGVIGTRTLALSPDGRYAAMIIGATSKRYLRIFDCNRGTMVLHQEVVRPVSSMTWDPQNRFLVVGEKRGTVIFLSFRGELLRRGIRLDPPEAPWRLAMSPEGERLAVGTHHSVGIYAINGRRKIWGHGPEDLERYDKIMSVRFSADGRELIGLRDHYPPRTSLVAWDADSGVERRSRDIGTHYTSMLEISPDGRLIATEGHDNTLVLCDAKTFEPLVLNEPASHPDIVNNHNFPRGVFPSPDGTRLLQTGWTNLTMWDVDTGRRMWTAGRRDPVHAAAWNSTGQWFAIVRGGTYDHEPGPTAFEILNAGDGRLLWHYPLDDSNGAAAHVLSDDRIVVCTQHHARLFSASGRQLWKTQLASGTRSADICVSPDECRLVVVRRNANSAWYSNGHMLLLETETGQPIRGFRGVTTPMKAAFSADGKRLFAATSTARRRGNVQMLLEEWDVATGERVNNPHLPDDPKHGVDFFSEHSEELCQAIMDRSPLLIDDVSTPPGRMGVSADRRWLALEKPIGRDEREAGGIPRWSKRLLLWDIEHERALGDLVLPGWFSHVAVFRDGRLAILNSNDTIFVVQRPEFLNEGSFEVGEPNGTDEKPADTTPPENDQSPPDDSPAAARHLWGDRHDTSEIRGRWLLQKLTGPDGEDPPKTKPVELVITDDHWQSYVNGRPKIRLRIEADPSLDPKQFIIYHPLQAGQHFRGSLGIYRLVDDMLEFAMSAEGDPCGPPSFDAEGTQRQLWKRAPDTPQAARIVAFHRAEDSPSEGLIEKTIEKSEKKVYLYAEPDVSDEHIARASLQTDTVGQVAIEIEFTDEGTKKMEALTVAHVEKRLAIVVNGKVVSAPTIKSKISGKALITGNFTREEAQRIVDALAKERDGPRDENQGGNENPAVPPKNGETAPRPAPVDDTSQSGQITGQLANAEGEAVRVGNATVFLCDAKTGYPIIAETKKPLGQATVEGIDELWHAKTDEDGGFEFEEVPVGLYRLVAQSWPDINQIPTMQGEASTRVRLHGVVENVRVDGDTPAETAVRSLGDGVLRIRNDPEEAHAFLFLSRAPTIGDPILGPDGWGERFIAEAIGVTLMEETYVTIEGLPDGEDLHVALLNYDNNPGIGGGTFRVGRQREVRLEILATWSNGKHAPPARLLELVQHFEMNNLSVSELIGLEKTDIHNYRELRRIVKEDPERVIEVQALGEFRLIDLWAASRYKYLRASHRARRAR